MFRRKLANVPKKGDSTVRRSHVSPDELLSRPAGDQVTTIGDIFPYCAKKYGNRTACMYRDITDVVEEVKPVKRSDGTMEDKVWKFFTLSDPVPVTYQAMDASANALAAGLIALGFSSPHTVPLASRARVSVYADTSLNWQLMAQAFARLGHVITTAYTTLGEDGLFTSWDEPEVELCFFGDTQAEMVSKVVGRAERIKYAVLDGSKRADKTVVDKIDRVLRSRGGRLITIEELKTLGESQPIKSAADLGERPKEDDLFCIMYTSGSTGSPKGVLLTHKNMIASLAGSIKLWGAQIPTPQNDLLLAFLPLAHILEQFLEYTFYLLGVPIGYATVKTLLDDSVRNCKGDFGAYRPTLMAGVPAIYEMIRKGMMKKISEAPAALGTVFGLAVKGKQTLPWPFSTVIDKVLFARVKAATGGRLRFTVCGGGALSRETQLFLSTVLAPMMQGYGLTETCGMTAITTPDMWLLGSVGTLGPSTEAKLVDCPDLGYANANSPPQGEIWLRGANVFKGYFKQDDLTRETLTEDGWFKTGDIGQWEANGTLTIIDRVKNLIKLSNGEYIALDKLESIYKSTDVVMMMCIAAPPQADRPVAIVYPFEGILRNHLKAAGMPSDAGVEAWATDPKLKQYILDQMLLVGKKGGLQKSEIIKDVILATEEWSPDNNMLTPAMKLNRPFISKTFQKEISAAYGQ